MPAPDRADPQRLAELRAMIDAIDESVHRLLIQRATVIDELIEVKGTATNGAAFRPGREADMMRRLRARHSGNLPLGAVEHLWREIISTFTALQAPFRVAVAAEGEVVESVEIARFTFGFTVPLSVLAASRDVVAWMEEGRHDRLGVVPLGRGGGPWWEELRTAQVVARLPFFAGVERQAKSPALVLAPPLADPVPFEIGCFVLPAQAIHHPSLAALGLEILGQGPSSCLVAGAGGETPERAASAAGVDIRAVGGYAAPLRVDG